MKAAFQPAKAKVMIGKVFLRLADERGDLDNEQNLTWLKDVSVPLDQYMRGFTPDIQDEVQSFMGHIASHSQSILSRIPFDLGGGAGVPLLYALVRSRRPNIVVETGVAAGFSSATILSAMGKNAAGHLYSSDFPYFRIANAEQYVGIVVEEKLKARWTLYLEGDAANLPKIMQAVPDDGLDIFHYDSDKSYKGRIFAMKLAEGKLAQNGIIIMDDIQDNAFFHDWVQSHPAYNWKVFSYANKFIGIASKASINP